MCNHERDTEVVEATNSQVEDILDSNLVDIQVGNSRTQVVMLHHLVWVIREDRQLDMASSRLNTFQAFYPKLNDSSRWLIKIGLAKYRSRNCSRH